MALGWKREIIARGLTQIEEARRIGDRFFPCKSPLSKALAGTRRAREAHAGQSEQASALRNQSLDRVALALRL